MSLFSKNLVGVSLLSVSGALAADTAGCKDMKLLARVPGCVIMECSAKRSDSVKFQMDAERQEPMDGPANLVRYSCAMPQTLDTLTRDLLPAIKKAGFNVVYQDHDDPTNRVITAQKGNLWLGAEAATADSGGVEYSLVTVEGGPARPLTGEVCSEAALLTLPKGCVSSECNAKRNESVEMRNSAQSQVALTGALRSSAIACDTAIKTAQLFDAAQNALKGAGFEQVFTQRERPEYSWLTARSGKRWVEFMSFQDGESIAYQLTDVLAESVKAAEKPVEAPEAKPAVAAPERLLEAEPSHATPLQVEAPVKAAEPEPVHTAPPPQVEAAVKAPEPEPVPVPPSPSPPSESPAASNSPAPVVPASTSLPAPATPSVVSSSPVLPPKPLRRTPISVSEELRKSLTNDVLVNVTADVDEQGFVVKASLAPGPQARDAEKLAAEAAQAVMLWRFEPARQDGKRVRSQVVVQVKYKYVPERPNIPSIRH